MKRRSYTKIRRAEAENETRLRIVEALISLHEDVGPALTTVSAVAQRAGVERLTVYRHFPDEAAMLRACTAHWSAMNPPPPIPDRRRGDAMTSCRRTLLQLYTWYRGNARMLTRVTADIDKVAAVRAEFSEIEKYLRHFASAIDRQWPRRSERRLATIRHAVEFSTWQSLDRITGSDRQSVDLVMAWLR